MKLSFRRRPKALEPVVEASAPPALTPEPADEPINDAPEAEPTMDASTTEASIDRLTSTIRREKDRLRSRNEQAGPGSRYPESTR